MKIHINTFEGRRSINTDAAPSSFAMLDAYLRTVQIGGLLCKVHGGWKYFNVHGIGTFIARTLKELSYEQWRTEISFAAAKTSIHHVS